jgi:hypothetical protein
MPEDVASEHSSMFFLFLFVYYAAENVNDNVSVFRQDFKSYTGFYISYKILSDFKRSPYHYGIYEMEVMNQ